MITRRPVGRAQAITWVVVVVAFVSAVVWLAESLRPMQPEEVTLVDPREAPRCPAPTEASGREPPPARRTLVDVTSADLYGCPAAFDGSAVRFRGEIVGALLRRGALVWTQVNDDVYALRGPLPSHGAFAGRNTGVGVLLPQAASADLTNVGGPRRSGDTIEVIGTFHRVDPGTHEIAVIRAESVRVVAKGSAVTTAVGPDRTVAAALLALAALGATAWHATVRRRAWTQPRA